MFNIQFTNGAQLGANSLPVFSRWVLPLQRSQFFRNHYVSPGQKVYTFDVDPILLVTSCATARVVDLTCVRLSAISGSSRHQFWLHQISLGFSRVRSRNVLQYASSSHLIWLCSRVCLRVLFALISTSKVRSRLAFV